MRNSLLGEAANENSEKWQNVIKREKPIYSRENDIRTEIERDYTRIINTTAYRRMRHKTQVYFFPQNDHICTRMEHVVHVESISYTIAKYLGLNTELTRAIATAHDIGHSPFGHEGERILSEISEHEIGESFWHEKNGLDMVDKIELLEDPKGHRQNLNLTYGVRDGIIAHCGEIDQNNLKPRKEPIDLQNYKVPNQYLPYTWEGCVVKIADKIAYLGRDIIDSITLGILEKDLKELYEILDCSPNEIINNTNIINNFVYDLCTNSNIENGLCFSNKTFETIKQLKKFNYEKIYLADKIKKPTAYFRLVLNSIYDVLKEGYTQKARVKAICPQLMNDFENWLSDYWNLERKSENENDIIFNMQDERDCRKAILYYISGMTDNYAIESYRKIIGF